MTDEEIEERLPLHVRRHVEAEAQEIRSPGFLRHVEDQIALAFFIDQPIGDTLEIPGSVKARNIGIDDLAVKRLARLRFQLRFEDRGIVALGSLDAHASDYRFRPCCQWTPLRQIFAIRIRRKPIRFEARRRGARRLFAELDEFRRRRKIREREIAKLR